VAFIFPRAQREIELVLEELDTLLVKTDGQLFYSLFENKISQDSKQDKPLASFPEARRPLMHPRNQTPAEGLCFFHDAIVRASLIRPITEVRPPARLDRSHDGCDKTWDGRDSVGLRSCPDYWCYASAPLELMGDVA
jgi:hypothetical protein